jgi:hypothetical protein
MADSGYSLDTKSEANSEAAGGASGGNTTGSVFYSGSSKGVPAWALVAAGVAILFLWMRKK